MISECCGAYPLYDLYDNGEYELLGICSDCKEHCEFESEEA